MSDFEVGEQIELDEHWHGFDVALGMIEGVGADGTKRALVLKVGGIYVVLDAADARQLASRLLEAAVDLEDAIPVPPPPRLA